MVLRGGVCVFFLRKMIPNEYEITSQSKFWTRNVRNWTESLVSGVWFLSPEAGVGEPSGGNWGNPNGPDAVQRFKTLYKNPLEIPKGIPS